MPFCRFQIDSPLTMQAVLLRVRGLMREAPSFVQSIKESFGRRPEECPPFIGTIDGAAFHMRRDIRYHNSFLPQVHGSVMSAPAGARVLVTMHLHPVVAAFMLFWLGAVGVGAIVAFTAQNESIQSVLIPAGMFFLASYSPWEASTPKQSKLGTCWSKALQPLTPNHSFKRTRL